MTRQQSPETYVLASLLKVSTWAAMLGLLGERDFLDATHSIDQHPDDWDGPCECDTCLSYNDG